ncbi:hypothetical protein BDZ94DRAFT_1244199 [Collybia nuda]|uniref:Uncharacterized protein n=1 Tax=Collybia nuda TaxID=64659 RepID=A0A9P5YIL3_9AGAR|nr:hypothetical protein BDZ94DRAFT_1244199 [Collybia nuda]
MQRFVYPQASDGITIFYPEDIVTTSVLFFLFSYSLFRNVPFLCSSAHRDRISFGVDVFHCCHEFKVWNDLLLQVF